MGGRAALDSDLADAVVFAGGGDHGLAFDDVDVMFRAFADRTRLRLLNILREGETCVGDLVSIVDAPQPTISRHLAYLRRAGLVHFEKRGTL